MVRCSPPHLVVGPVRWIAPKTLCSGIDAYPHRFNALENPRSMDGPEHHPVIGSHRPKSNTGGEPLDLADCLNFLDLVESCFPCGNESPKEPSTRLHAQTGWKEVKPDQRPCGIE